MEKHWYLSNVAITNDLQEDERSFFYKKSFKKKYPKNSIIFSPGDEGNLIYYVISGRVKIYTLSRCGKEVIYWFCHPKNLFGLAEICGGEMRTVFAEATEDTEVLCINKTNFEELIQRNPRIALSIMKILGSRIRQTHETIKDLVVCDVRSRMAQLLVKFAQICGLSREDSVVLDKKFTHQEMANMIGATRTTVTEIINDFKRKGYVRCDGSRITILNYTKLISMINPPD